MYLSSNIYTHVYCFVVFWQIKEMESMYKEIGEASLTQEYCKALATSFRLSTLLANLYRYHFYLFDRRVLFLLKYYNVLYQTKNESRLNINLCNSLPFYIFGSFSASHAARPAITWHQVFIFIRPENLIFPLLDPFITFVLFWFRFRCKVGSGINRKSHMQKPILHLRPSSYLLIFLVKVFQAMNLRCQISQ